MGSNPVGPDRNTNNKVAVLPILPEELEEQNRDSWDSRDRNMAILHSRDRNMAIPNNRDNNMAIPDNRSGAPSILEDQHVRHRHNSVRHDILRRDILQYGHRLRDLHRVLRLHVRHLCLRDFLPEHTPVK
jgi:hypothetical protein